MVRSRALALLIGAAGTLGVTACGAAAGGSSRAHSHRVLENRVTAATMARGPRLGAFAGENLLSSQVRSAAGSWRVPGIDLSSPPGSGSTWIGVQQPQGGQVRFIQVGTTDQRVERGLDNYYMFWSDTAHRFAPMWLGWVLPGDRITASLRLDDGRWRLRIVDHASHTVRTVDTRQETGGPVQQAEWLQEDPGTGYGLTTHVPYASTAPVVFSRLKVNGATPAPARLVPQSMGLADSDLRPSGVRGDAFTVSVAPSSAAPTDAAVNPPAEFDRGTAQPPRTGTWQANGRVMTSAGYADDPPGLAYRRTWLITRSCSPDASCNYELTRSLDTGVTERAALVPTAGGWRADWPPIRSQCGGSANFPVYWNDQERWYLRFSDHGREAEGHDSSFSYTPACGDGRSSTDWSAELIPVAPTPTAPHTS